MCVGRLGARTAEEGTRGFMYEECMSSLRFGHAKTGGPPLRKSVHGFSLLASVCVGCWYGSYIGMVIGSGNGYVIVLFWTPVRSYPDNDRSTPG